METIRAAVCLGPGQPLEVRPVQLDPPGDGEVLVALRAAGVCHSDLSAVDGAIAARFPVVVGHEGAGVVEAVGPAVRSVAPGDHVVLSWVATCRRCFWCTHGQPQLCLSGVRHNGAMDDGTTRLHLDGEPLYHGIDVAAFAEKAVVRETAVIRVDATIPFERAALAGCAVTTGVGAVVRSAQVEAGERVVVVGCGGVGLSAVQGARLAGASLIVAVDPVAARRDAALRLGATHALEPSATLPKEVKAMTGGIGADAVIECAGRAELQRLAWDMTRRGGRAILVGLPPSAAETTFPSLLLTIWERQVRGSFYGSCDPLRDIPWILELAEAGRLDLDALISQRVPLEGVGEALEAMRRGEQLRTILTF
jgi:S-(hydroxymethyl)glutathione dehydrogenase / alcohol dehydrogenase